MKISCIFDRGVTFKPLPVKKDQLRLESTGKGRKTQLGINFAERRPEKDY